MSRNAAGYFATAFIGRCSMSNANAKVIIGIGCLMASLFPALLVLVGLDWSPFNLPCAFCFLALAAMGGVYITKRNSSFPWHAKILITTWMRISAGFIVVIVVPAWVRATSQTAANGCINNLRQIDAAKNEWALENHKTNGTVVTEDDLKPYIKLDSQGNLPTCQNGGVYINGRIGEEPRCSIGDSLWPNIHALSYTNDWWTDFKMACRRLFGLQSHPRTSSRESQRAG